MYIALYYMKNMRIAITIVCYVFTIHKEPLLQMHIKAITNCIAAYMS